MTMRRSAGALRRQLTARGHLVVEADGGAAALAAGAQVFDLVLVDLLMPRIDGLEVTARLRAAAGWAASVIVLMTGSSDDENDRAARRAGADGIVLKPFGIAELDAWLRPTRDRGCA